MKTYYVLVISLAVVLGLTLQSANYAEDNNSPVQIDCTCVAASTGLCELAIVDKITKEQRIIWSQQEYATKATPAADLAAACYRKRNDPDKGNGLCCEPRGDEYISHLFKGEIK